MAVGRPGKPILTQFQFPKDGKSMRSNRPSSYLAMAAIMATASTAGAQRAAVDDSPGARVAQAAAPPATDPEPAAEPVPAATPTPSTPEVPHLPEDVLRKMIDEQMAKGIKPKVGDVHFSGYFRAGYGVSSEGGRQVCFQAPGAFAKYRLGNECDLYGEFLFSGPAYVGDNGVVATANIMFNVYIGTSGQGYPDRFTTPDGQVGKDVHFGTNQFFVDFKGLPFLGDGARAWIGRRFYKREDIHANDYFWWNASGLGGGLEDIPVSGPMKLSYGAFVVEGPPPVVSEGPPSIIGVPQQKDLAIRNDLRLYGILLNPGGELVLGVNGILNVSNDNATNSGFSATAMYVLKTPVATSKTAVQYGLGAAVADNGVAGSLLTSTGTSFVRGIENLELQLTPELGGQVVAVLNRTDVDGGATTTWLSAGGRISYAFNANAQLGVDAGFDTVKVSDTDRRNVFKMGVAPAISAGKAYFSRPTLRLFASLAFWNAAARTAGVDSSGIYTRTDKTFGANFGIQSESWW